ncbi:hypothetical protein BDV18DRAFT_12711 [Aspergillus unguis]
MYTCQAIHHYVSWPSFGWLARRCQTFTSTQTRSNRQFCATLTGYVITHLYPTFGALRMRSSSMWLLPSVPPAVLHRGSAKPVRTGCCPKQTTGRPGRDCPSTFQYCPC